MKKLEKLRLQNLEEIDVAEQSSFKGGGEIIWDGSDYYCYEEPFPYASVGEVYCYGGSGSIIDNALSEFGVTSGDTSRLKDYFNSTSHQTVNSNAWCSAYVNYIMDRSGFYGTDSALARSWQTWGESTDSPQSGDICVAADGSHVGFVIKVDDELKMLSGNWGGAVKIDDIPDGYIYRTGGI